MVLSNNLGPVITKFNVCHFRLVPTPVRSDGSDGCRGGDTASVLRSPLKVIFVRRLHAITLSWCVWQITLLEMKSSFIMKPLFCGYGSIVFTHGSFRKRSRFELKVMETKITLGNRLLAIYWVMSLLLLHMKSAMQEVNSLSESNVQLHTQACFLNNWLSPIWNGLISWYPTLSMLVPASVLDDCEPLHLHPGSREYRVERLRVDVKMDMQ